MKFSTVLILSVLITKVYCQDKNINVYLFPGQGSDQCIFSELRFPEGYTLHYIAYPVPEKKQDLKAYAHSFIPRIDNRHPFILIGVSLGGMICTELADSLDPMGVILISSAKCRPELPWRYRFQRSVPLNRMIPKSMIKTGAIILQPIVEPDRKHKKDTFKSMLKSKDKTYLKRTVDMIINWDRESYPDGLVHIHGDRDNTIPVRNVKYDYLVKEGSHMMTLTRSNEISCIINEILETI